MATDDDPEPDSKEQARELRRQGLSIAQIAYALGRRAHAPVARWVADVPPPEWTKRPRAKDDLRARRESEREQVKAAARALVGPVTDRELTLVGAVLYWAEGAKDKPYARREKVSFINSDSEVIILFQRWLDLMKVPEENRRYRLSIHVSADLESAHAWWSQVTGIPLDRFDRPTLKRHNPQTVRLNIGDSYHGCLVISVCKSRVLYQQVDGLFHGIVAGATASAPATQDPPRTG